MIELTRVQKFLHLFLPHPHNHQKAKLLSWHYLVIYILLFILLRSTFDLISIYKPGVLGTTSSITIQKVVEDINQERVKLGLPPLEENESLKKAALAKAANMFEENYWAHFSPAGRDPWGFITTSGYKYSYAGENLARNFYNSEDMVEAWMNSPSHKENIVNPNYQDTGIAVVEGVLLGQKTTLVVQMFGRSRVAPAVASKTDLSGSKVEVPVNELARSQVLNAAQNLTLSKPLLDPFWVVKIVGMGLIVLVSFLILMDFIILKQRGVFRLTSHHFAHLSFLAASSMALISSKVGEIL
ncbi:MAG: CAP domain-containing protein [Candidatus Daviesbacteria bacterium]|nr:CAP domain-containing protein [Candidatus Daviesbacteria bacterium]